MKIVDAKNIRERLAKLREIAAKSPSPLKGLSMEEAIRKIRKTREELWEEKLAAGSRHK